MVWDVLAYVGGVVVVLATLLSAVRTVAVPRGESVLITQVLFRSMRVLSRGLERLTRRDDHRQAIRARFAPMTMLLLPGAWAVGVIGGFSAMYWALGVRPYRESLVLSGSSFTTLGFRSTDSTVELIHAIVEAVLGLGVIALLLSFMPALYSAFSRREALVSRLEVRAGTPPSPEAFIIRAHRIGWLPELGDTWAHWEEWFVEVEESHTTYAALNFFRSPVDTRSWIAAASAMLDAASLQQSTIALRSDPEAALVIRAGYMALRRIADFFGIEHDPDPAPDDPISVSRGEWDAMYDELAEAGVPLVSDRDQAWRDFAGWRVNYDRVLVAIASLIDSPLPGLRPTS